MGVTLANLQSTGTSPVSQDCWYMMERGLVSSSASSFSTLRAALNPFIPQSVLIMVPVLTQVKDLALGLVELHEVHMGPIFKPVKVPLDGIREGVFNPTDYIINKDIEQYWSHYRPLRDTTCYQFQFGH
ncbi:hypothetical protein QYF61_015447 [Mycteria americana]|uniref:Uncharacterized protein n=1 Tax=Mycteria americana TaxID=33587 RepID=A0AAN7NVF5_MYCAM|nr:hypothetical protein QYF61_015447 [Mycteria americana]